MKKYFEYLNELDSKSLLKGLLKYGLFNHKMPSILTSENYYEYIISKKMPFDFFPDKKSWSEWIRYESNRNNNLPRTLGIPNPFAHYFLCKEIIDDWDKIVTYFESKTKHQIFKNSQIHVRRIKNSDQIFDLSYSFEKNNGIDIPKNIIDCKYVVKTDISKCFESIYSHSLSWALIGKEKAKSRIKDSTFFGNNLDKKLQSEKNGETHGILIGPLTSNILSEIVLCNVDDFLSKKYRFVRRIDDYSCYVATIDEGNSFINDLRRELSKFDLSLNMAKTKIVSIHEHEIDNFPDRVRSISHVLDYEPYSRCETYPEGVISYRQIVSFFNLLGDIFVKSNNNSSVYYYAFKILKQKNLSIRASEYYVNKAMNLCISFPYLLPSIQQQVFSKYGVTKNIDMFCKTLFSNGLTENNYEKLFYSLYFGIVYNVDSVCDKRELLNNAKSIDDCMFKFIAWKYSSTFSPKEYDAEYHLIAEKYATSDEMFDRYWIFVYEILESSYLGGNWKKLKDAKVSFVDDNKLKPIVHFKSMFYE